MLLNKTDLTSVTTEEMLGERLCGHPILSVSAKENQGIEILESTLRDMFFEGRLSFNDQVYITNMRHKDALTQALESLKQVQMSLDMQMPEDFYSIDLMSAYEELGLIVGESVGRTW